MTTVLTRARHWLRSLFLRRRLEAEMQRELAQHLDRATGRLVARGLSTTDARATALREFGNVTYIKEEGRQARGTRWLEALGADARFAIRHFRRNPGATVTMLIVLAIGMSISTALFSFIRSYATQPPLGVAGADDLVRIRGRDLRLGGLRLRPFTMEELAQYQGLTSHFTAVAGSATSWVTLYMDANAGRSESAKATFVTPNYFDLAGVRPVIGAGLPRTESTDAGPQLVAVVSDGVWRRFFSRSPSALGATLIVEGVPVTIVGVAPPRFSGLADYSEMMVWMPTATRPVIIPRARPDAAAFIAVARLAPGTDHQRAAAAAEVIARRVAAAEAEGQPTADERRIGTDVVPLRATNESPEFDSEVVGMGVGATVLGILILLITCTNVSALQTGLALMRRREIAIRLSMGASRRRIVRQLLTETIILATLAGGTGLGMVWLLQRLVATRVPDLPVQIAVSGAVLAFTFGLALAVGTLFGLSPALHATRLTVSNALKDSTGSIAAPRVRLQRGLVVAQVALTQPLIVILGVVMAVLYAEYQSQGLDRPGEQIVSVRLRPTGPDAADSAPQWASEIRGLRDRLLSTPAIEGAVQELGSTVSLAQYRVHPEDRVGPASEQSVRLSAPLVAPGYFGVMGMRIAVGRDFTDRDRTPPKDPTYAGIEIPVIIGSDLASALWPGANPVGRRLQYGPDPALGGPPLTVIGVLEPESVGGVSAYNETYKVFFPPDSAAAASSLELMVRTRGDGRSAIPTIRNVVQQQTSRLVITEARTVADLEMGTLDAIRLAATSLGTAGLLTLFLAAIGLYGVVSFAVGQRTSEIAVRMAIGANERQIVGRFIGEGVKLGIIGLVVGLPVSLIGLHFLSSTFSGPPVPIAGIAVAAAVGVLVVALAATWVPARRAAGVNPATVLRRD